MNSSLFHAPDEATWDCGLSGASRQPEIDSSLDVSWASAADGWVLSQVLGWSSAANPEEEEEEEEELFGAEGVQNRVTAFIHLQMPDQPCRTMAWCFSGRRRLGVPTNQGTVECHLLRPPQKWAAAQAP